MTSDRELHGADPRWPSHAQILVLRQSLLRLIPACEEASDRFYARLFDAHPALRPMFPANMEPQKEKLVLMLASAIDLLVDPAEFSASCLELGDRHAGYGALPAHYPIVAEYAIEEISRVAQPPLTAEEAEAWTRLFDLVSEKMLLGTQPAS